MLETADVNESYDIVIDKWTTAPQFKASLYKDGDRESQYTYTPPPHPHRVIKTMERAFYVTKRQGDNFISSHKHKHNQRLKHHHVIHVNHSLGKLITFIPQPTCPT